MTRAGEEMYLLLTWYVKDASYEILLPPNADMQYFNIKVIHSSTRSGGQKPLLAKEPFLPMSISKKNKKINKKICLEQQNTFVSNKQVTLHKKSKFACQDYHQA